MVKTSSVLCALSLKVRRLISKSFFLRVQEQNVLCLLFQKRMIWLRALQSGMNYLFLKFLERYLSNLLSSFLSSFLICFSVSFPVIVSSFWGLSNILNFLAVW